METMQEQVMHALKTIRAPLQQGEYDLHALVLDALAAAGIQAQHEVRLGPGCRIDLLAGGVGVEIKRGKPVRAQVIRQLTRYAACAQVEALILVAERHVEVPHIMMGKPVQTVCLNRLWGIAL